MQRDYSLAWTDREVFPSWEKLHICSSITKSVLDKKHVEKQRLAWARAFLHELTTLSFGRRIKCIDPYIISFQACGKSVVCTFADLHTLIIMLQCRASQRGRFLMLLHEQSWANPYDGDNHFFHGLGKNFFHPIHVQIIPMISIISQNIFPCTFLEEQFAKLHYALLGDC